MTKSLPPKSLVLYADDDADDLALLREAFSEYTHVIDLLTFHSGVELLQYLEQLSSLQPAPCLIILDINMPRINGLEVLKKLRSKKGYQDIPVVLFSTSTLPSEAAHAHSLNAGFVTKPLVNGQIHQIVDALLAHCNDEIKQRLYRK
jgi:CheY-like chemotaxis protein